MHVRLHFAATLSAVIVGAAAILGCQHDARNTAAAARLPALRHQAAPRVVPAHVQTAEYLWTPQERAADPRQYAPFLTYAYPLYQQFGRVGSAGIKTVLYVNPLMPEPGERFEFPAVTAQPALQAKDCSGNPVRAYNGTSYLLDVLSKDAPQAVRAIVDSYVEMVRQQNPRSGRPVDLVFVDNANSFYGVQPMPCGFNQGAWTAGVERALSLVSYPTVINTLSVRPWVVPSKVQALHGRTITGLMYEACFTDTQWSAEQAAQILTLQTLRRLHKPPGAGFWCYVNGKATQHDAQDVTSQRLFEYASFLLTYDPQYSVYQTAYASPPSTFKVLPETQFVPMLPAVTPASIDDLRVDGGAYVQRFHYCYYRGKLLGSCEVAVNPGNATQAIPTGDYRHSATLHGNGVLDGGAMAFNGPPVRELLPGTAAILVK